MCVEELVRLRDRYDEFQAAGVDIAVVSTDTPERSKHAAKKYEFLFDVISDDRSLLMSTLGVRHAGQGPGSSDIFYATLYLVDHQGQVVWTFASQGTNDRATPDLILEAASRP